MVEHRKLGRGLSTLIPTERAVQPDSATPEKAKAKPAAPIANLPASALRDVPTESIVPNPHQPRLHFEEESLNELAKSIKEIGILQPLLVREMAPGQYQLIAGERRWRAAQQAKLSLVPVVVREITELDSVEQALVENLHREDLTALEEASAYQQLSEDFSLTHERIAKRVGKSRAAVTNALRLLTLPAAVQGFLADGRLSAGHARAILGASSAQQMEELAVTAVADGWSVRATEDAVRSGTRAITKPVVTTGTTLRPAGLLELENLLAEFLDTKVSVSISGKRGRVGIDFADLVDLERIYRKMTESGS